MAKSTNLLSLKRYCNWFRVALEECINKKSIDVSIYPELESFPFGCCGISSRILGIYLFDQGLGLPDYVYAESSTVKLRTQSSTNYYQYIQGHAWLEMNSIIIDITTDQFDGIKTPVFIAEESRFHECFTIVGKHKCCDLDSRDQYIYNIIKHYDQI